MDGLDDSRRSEVPRCLGSTDGPSSPALDVICRLAADYFRVPIAAINFIDTDRNVLAGRYGIDRRCTALQGSICSLVNAPCTAVHGSICTPPFPADDVLIIEDAGSDPRLSGSSLVAGDLCIRFYAGLPVFYDSDDCLGVLFIADRRLRAFSRDDCDGLRRLAYLAAMELRRSRAELRNEEQERVLNLQESVMAHAQELAAVAMWEWDLDTDQLRWSDEVYRQFGSAPGSLGASLEAYFALIHPSDRAGVEAIVHAVRSQGGAIDAKYRIIRPDGQIRSLISRGATLNEDGRPVRAVGVIQDVTDPEQREVALRASEARWSLALKTGRMVAFDLDLGTGALILSDHAEEMLGFTADLYTELFDAIHAEDRDLIKNTMDQAVAAQSSFQVEFRLVRPDERIVWVSQSGGPAEGTSDDTRHLTGVFIDITEQKELQHSLQASEERARHFADVSSDWLWETDQKLRFTLILGGPKYFSYEGASAIIGKTRWEHAGADPETQPWKDHIQQLKQRLPFRDFEYEVRDKAGTLRWVSTSGQPVFDAQCRFRGYRGTASDQTSRKRLEAKLQETERMEALGQLSGGVAHDFNNLLTIIMGNAEVLVDRLASDAELQPLAALILSAAERGADLTDRLLAYARRQTLEPVSMSVNAAVERMAGILQRSVGEHIRLELSLADDLHWAHVDAALLESTILNLAVNARDAMPHGGTMTIATKNLVVDRTESEALRDLTPGDYVQTDVIDNGMGMAPEVLQRVFEPFYTTKEVGKGSGLGLPMAQGFASQSGGQIAVRSSPGCGTKVSLILPRSKSVPPAGDERAGADVLTGGRERILVVEDEPDVRQFVVGQLASLGYETEEAGDGPSALEVLHSSPAFDLLLTDVVLPMHMNGIELAAQARASFPQLKVLFSSGFSAQISAFADVRELGAMLLFKPYRRQELAALVRQAIDA